LGIADVDYVSKMNVALTPELEQLIHRKVVSGLYLSASEVVRDALRLLKERDRLDAIRSRWRRNSSSVLP
jgi:antitoxin ParD1/3/4